MSHSTHTSSTATAPHNTGRDVALIAVFAVQFGVPETKSDQLQPMDWKGVVGLVIGAAAILTALNIAGELAAAGVHVLGKTVAEVADAWAPYLTMAEGIRIAAKAFTTDPSLLSCCA